MKFGEPPLAKFKIPLVLLISFFAAYCFYAMGVGYFEWGPVGAIILAIGGYAIFGFLQGAIAIVNIVGFPALSYFTELFGTLGYWLGGLSLAVFLLTQFRHVKRV